MLQIRIVKRAAAASSDARNSVVKCTHSSRTRATMSLSAQAAAVLDALASKSSSGIRKRMRGPTKHRIPFRAISTRV
ncbi:hypothetical protein Hdeb2414_s0002g00053771 [Helianthus debilis subsp. tardiflorus]